MLSNRNTHVQYIGYLHRYVDRQNQAEWEVGFVTTSRYVLLVLGLTRN